MEWIPFSSYNTRNIFRLGLFLEHLGEAKVNQFLAYRLLKPMGNLNVNLAFLEESSNI